MTGSDTDVPQAVGRPLSETDKVSVCGPRDGQVNAVVAAEGSEKAAAGLQEKVSLSPGSGSTAVAVAETLAPTAAVAGLTTADVMLGQLLGSAIVNSTVALPTAGAFPPQPGNALNTATIDDRTTELRWPDTLAR